MRSLLKKIGIFLLGGTIIVSNVTIAATDWYDDITKEYGTDVELSVNGVNTIGTTDTNEDTGYKILDTIQRTINRILGMLSFVALILCLWGGFQMLTAGGDDAKVKSGTKILKNAGLGLAVIGLAWLVVSFVFRIVDKVSG